MKVLTSDNQTVELCDELVENSLFFKENPVLCENDELVPLTTISRPIKEGSDETLDVEPTFAFINTLNEMYKNNDFSKLSTLDLDEWCCKYYLFSDFIDNKDLKDRCVAIIREEIFKSE